jgi:Peptidase inhibitor I78 family
MRKAGLGLPALLCACAAAQPAVHGETPGHSCRTAGTNRFIGQTRSDPVGAAITKASRAAVLRWAPPGVMLTMDFRDDRVTVYLGPDQKITRIVCG